MPTANLLRIPQFLSAPTREGLVLLMLNNNLEHSREFIYFDISFQNEEWTVWFFHAVDFKDRKIEGNNVAKPS